MGDSVDFDFKVLNPVTYECIFTFRFPSRIMRMAIERSKPKLRAEGIDADKLKYDAVTKWPIEVKFYNVMRTGITSFVADVKKQVKEDGFIILTYQVVKAICFKKSHTEYVVDVYVQGNYSGG